MSETTTTTTTTTTARSESGNEMETPVTTWLNEGLRHYSAGDAARALEAWYRVLEVEPSHPAALEYVAFVRDAIRADGTPTPTPSAEPSERAAAPPTAPTASVVAAVATNVTAPIAMRRADSVDAFSWADIVGGAIAAPAPLLTEAPAPVVEAATVAPAPVVEVEVAEAATEIEMDSGPIEVALDSEPDDSVEISMADDDFHGLPSMIIADDAHLPDSPPSRGFAGDHDEIMPAPDAVSAPRPISRRLPSVARSERAPTPMSFEAPSKVSAIEIAPVVIVPPVIDLPRAPTPMMLPLEDRVVRQSIRFDEPRSTSRSPSPAEVSPVVEHASSTLSSASPWDDAVGPAEPLDLDVSARPVSSFDTLLRSSAISSTPMILSIEEDTIAVIGARPTPEMAGDGLEALMTGARELFELGDFSGSLELVEKVLRTNPQHEGGLAYLRRNEATLMRMYESKIGDMTRLPRSLVPPDEVIWMNMHHRAGFILSQVDGTLSYEDLLEVSGMDRFETVRIVADLVSAGIIG